GLTPCDAERSYPAKLHESPRRLRQRSKHRMTDVERRDVPPLVLGPATLLRLKIDLAHTERFGQNVAVNACTCRHQHASSGSDVLGDKRARPLVESSRRKQNEAAAGIALCLVPFCQPRGSYTFDPISASVGPGRHESLLNVERVLF